jgi:hypothetical protein
MAVTEQKPRYRRQAELCYEIAVMIGCEKAAHESSGRAAGPGLVRDEEQSSLVPEMPFEREAHPFLATYQLSTRNAGVSLRRLRQNACLEEQVKPGDNPRESLGRGRGSARKKRSMRCAQCGQPRPKSDGLNTAAPLTTPPARTLKSCTPLNE